MAPKVAPYSRRDAEEVQSKTTRLCREVMEKTGKYPSADDIGSRPEADEPGYSGLGNVTPEERDRLVYQLTHKLPTREKHALRNAFKQKRQTGVVDKYEVASITRCKVANVDKILQSAVEHLGEGPGRELFRQILD